MSILQDIFTDYYEELKYTLHPRDYVMDNIDKNSTSVILLMADPMSSTVHDIYGAL